MTYEKNDSNTVFSCNSDDVFGIGVRSCFGKWYIEGIGLGNTREELIAAYGEPNSKSDDNFHDYVYEYDGYSITFSFGLEESIQHILYTNTPNYARYVGM